jgi:very-short-patch-repair endonuclease
MSPTKPLRPAGVSRSDSLYGREIATPPRKADADAVIAALAAEGWGVVARRELLDAGVTVKEINGRVATRRLLRLHSGVYAVGHTSLRPEGWRRAAVLAGGPGAVLSHRSAAEAWGLRAVSARARHDITVKHSRGRSSRHLDAHQCRLDRRDTTELDGIPITTVARTLLDLAEVVPRTQVQRAIETTIHLGHYDGFAIDDVMSRSNGRRGLKHLKAALAAAHPDAAHAKSALERLMLELIDAHGLPRPSVNIHIEGYERDLVWPHQRVIVELDSWRFHRTKEAFENDRRRDATLTPLGYRTLRFTWDQVTKDATFVARTLAATLRVPIPPTLPKPTPKRALAAASR